MKVQSRFASIGETGVKRSSHMLLFPPPIYPSSPLCSTNTDKLLGWYARTDHSYTTLGEATIRTSSPKAVSAPTMSFMHIAPPFY